MSRSVLLRTLAYLSTVATVACGAQSTLPPTSAALPEIEVVTGGGGLLAGEVVDFCFPDGGGCTESVPPSYTAPDFVPLPPGGNIDLHVTGATPTAIQFNLLPFTGNIVDIANLAASHQLVPVSPSMSWQPGVAPGLYVLEVIWQRNDDVAVYWFPVEIR